MHCSIVEGCDARTDLLRCRLWVLAERSVSIWIPLMSRWSFFAVLATVDNPKRSSNWGGKKKKKKKKRDKWAEVKSPRRFRVTNLFVATTPLTPHSTLQNQELLQSQVVDEPTLELLGFSILARCMDGAAEVLIHEKHGTHRVNPETSSWGEKEGH